MADLDLVLDLDPDLGLNSNVNLDTAVARTHFEALRSVLRDAPAERAWRWTRGGASSRWGEVQAQVQDEVRVQVQVRGGGALAVETGQDNGP